jgi:hypothetical protein
MTQPHHDPWIVWPFKAFWRLIAVIVGFTGRLVAVVIGAVLMILGGLVSLTIVGAIIGIPLAVVWLLIVLRGLF